MVKKFVLIVMLSVSMGTIAAQAATEYLETHQVNEQEHSALMSADESLLFMREEEKLARDLYIAFYEKWGIRVFANIARSEQRHMDAVGVLIERKGLKDPVANIKRGEFVDPSLSALYNDFLALGSKSLLDALTVGAMVEDLDINDLDRLLLDAKDNDSLQVYTALLRGSENHMRSFISLLARFGITYEPRSISQERLFGIVNGTR